MFKNHSCSWLHCTRFDCTFCKKNWLHAFVSCLFSSLPKGRKVGKYCENQHGFVVSKMHHSILPYNSKSD